MRYKRAAMTIAVTGATIVAGALGWGCSLAVVTILALAATGGSQTGPDAHGDLFVISITILNVWQSAYAAFVQFIARRAKAYSVVPFVVGATLCLAPLFLFSGGWLSGAVQEANEGLFNAALGAVSFLNLSAPTFAAAYAASTLVDWLWRRTPLTDAGDKRVRVLALGLLFLVTTVGGTAIAVVAILVVSFAVMSVEAFPLPLVMICIVTIWLGTVAIVVPWALRRANRLTSR